MGGAAIEGRLGRLADVGRRIEVRFAHLEMDDGAALSPERSRPDEHVRRRFLAESLHPL